MKCLKDNEPEDGSEGICKDRMSVGLHHGSFTATPSKPPGIPRQTAASRKDPRNCHHRAHHRLSRPIPERRSTELTDRGSVAGSERQRSAIRWLLAQSIQDGRRPENAAKGGSSPIESVGCDGDAEGTGRLSAWPSIRMISPGSAAPAHKFTSDAPNAKTPRLPN